MKKILVPYTIYGVEDRETVEKMLANSTVYAVPLNKPELALAELGTYEVTGLCSEGYLLDSDDAFQYIAVRGVEPSYIGSANEFAVRELNKALDIKSKSARHMRVGAIIHAMLNQLTLYEAAEVYEAIRMKDIS